MGPPKNAVRSISQEAFDEVVKENMDDLGMDPTEALQDAIQTLTLHGVDLSGIVTCVPGEGSVKDNPVIHCLDRLNQLNAGPSNQIDDERVELLINLQSSVQKGCEHAIVSALKALAFLLHDLQSRETFRASDGPKLVVGIITDGFENIDILSSGFAVIAAAATGNEVLKELFVELKIEELILRVLSVKREASIQSVYDAIRVLLTPDDNRVLASQVFGYARKFAKIGIAGALVDSIRAGLSSSSLVSASIALKAVAVNDEICTSISENGGVDAVLVCIDDSSEQGNKTVAKVCCSLLCKLAGSDANKTAIVEKKGMDRLIKLSARFFDDPSVLQRSPENAARAIEAGAGELALQAMQKFPAAQQMQKNSCLMIRNLVARNAANRQLCSHFNLTVPTSSFSLHRTLLLNSGVEKHIRVAKQSHVSCKEAATDALRDLGLDDYNG
ncbi:unnamed protein product [Prunus armeniaca]|uniref:Armadillo repeat-containing protein 6 n=1 Tax=Prunus armeniaca TaxID=36596 RepID=A0A6J5Y450_PRUAR|nr:unnamed protein product [Prunus armeniaca]